MTSASNVCTSRTFVGNYQRTHLYVDGLLLDYIRFLQFYVSSNTIIKILFSKVEYSIKESFGLIGIQLPEKYKENFERVAFGYQSEAFLLLPLYIPTRRHIRFRRISFTLWINLSQTPSCLGFRYVLKKSFDTIDHAILLRKLRIYGVDENGIKFFESYLKALSHYCVWEKRMRSVWKLKK
jgi:hypothetical protein